MVLLKFNSQRSFISIDDDDDDDEGCKDGVCLTEEKSPCYGSLELKPQLNKKSPEVAVVKEVSMKQRIEQMRESVEKLYNEKVHGGSGLSLGTTRMQKKAATVVGSEKLNENALNSTNHPFGTIKVSKTHPSSSVHLEENIIHEGSSALSFVSGFFGNKPSGGDACTPENHISLSNFAVTPKEVKLYTVVCSLAKSQKYSRSVVVDIGNCIVTLFSLGESMAPKNEVCTYVVNCMCRKFFMDERPTVNLKHYFFSNISDTLMEDSKDLSYVGRSFTIAAKVLALPLCSELFFPVLYGGHWFLFVVDLANKMFLFLDSLHSKHDNFSVFTRGKLIQRFCEAWDFFVMCDMGFSKFQVAYPHVPKQDNKFDCGVFTIKLMEMWNSGF